MWFWSLKLVRLVSACAWVEMPLKDCVATEDNREAALNKLLACRNIVLGVILKLCHRAAIE